MDSACTDGNLSNNNKKIKLEGNIKQEPSDTEDEQGIIHNYTGIKDEIDDPIVTVQGSELTTDTKENYFIHCEECGEEYDLYCLKCPMLIRILDSNKPNALDNRVRRTLPKHFIDFCETSSGVCIVALRVIPKGVVFGPFEELESTKGVTGSRWKLKNKELAYTKDPKRMNWMQYIRRANQSFHRNLTPFQYEDKVYYRSDCIISVGDELLVSFDSGSDESSIQDTNDSYWEPQVCERLDDTYACTFCCVGFKLISHLSAHNSKCPDKGNQTDFCKEIIQCAFCKIHLDEKEYSNYHIDRCCGGNSKKYVATSRSTDPTVKLEPTDRQYQCSLCDYRTSKRYRFKKHRERHTDDVRTYQCSECPFRASAEYDLQTHARAHSDRFKCFRCAERFFRADLFAAHQKKAHSVSVYECDKCAYETTNAKHLQRHLATHVEDVKPFPCDACGKQFTSRSVLLGHVRMVHKEKKKKYKCPRCDLETVYPGTIKTHLLNMHGGIKRFKCLRCAFKTHYKRQLERHLRFHDDAKPIKCESCDAEFWSAQTLRRHEKEAHDDVADKTYTCSKCEYRTSHRAYLKHHMTMHGRPQLTCDLCPYKTKVNSNLKRHVALTHNDDRPFKCDACALTFKEMTSLKKHARNMHAGREKKEYKCPQCAFETKYKGSFKNHTKTHESESFRCTKCDFNAHSKGGLTTHMKCSHGENGSQSFDCSICDKKFVHKGSLARHTKRVHAPKVEEEKSAIESDD